MLDMLRLSSLQRGLFVATSLSNTPEYCWPTSGPLRSNNTLPQQHYYPLAKHQLHMAKHQLQCRSILEDTVSAMHAYGMKPTRLGAGHMSCQQPVSLLGETNN